MLSKDKIDIYLGELGEKILAKFGSEASIDIVIVGGTEMYQRSREIYKMQKVKEKFLTVWYDHILDNEIRVNAIAEEV